tara:strand:+ start:3637 stop:5820 length:2184 start_codon:yes stop_codon:yes gene_type:complete
MPWDLNALLDIGREYRDNETVGNATSPDYLLSMMVDAIDYIPAQQHRDQVLLLLSCLSAGAQLLSSRHPDITDRHPGIHWKKLALFKREVFHEDLGRYRNMSHMADRVVYRSAITMEFHTKFVNHALSEIIQYDLPVLRQACYTILIMHDYRQEALIGQRIIALVNYAHDEYCCAKILEYIHDFLALPNLVALQGQRYVALWKLLIIGEAIGQLSKPSVTTISQDIRAQFFEVRTVLCHPERSPNHLIIDSVLGGEMDHPALSLNSLLVTVRRLPADIEALRQRFVDDSRGENQIRENINCRSRLRYDLHTRFAELGQIILGANTRDVERFIANPELERYAAVAWDDWFNRHIEEHDEEQQAYLRTVHTTKLPRVSAYLDNHEKLYDTLQYRLQSGIGVSNEEMELIQHYQNIENRHRLLSERYGALVECRGLTEVTAGHDQLLQEIKRESDNSSKQCERMVATLNRYEDQYEAMAQSSAYSYQAGAAESSLYEANIEDDYPELEAKHLDAMRELRHLERQQQQMQHDRQLLIERYHKQRACEVLPRIIAAIDAMSNCYTRIARATANLQMQRFDEAEMQLDAATLVKFDGDIMTAMAEAAQQQQRQNPRHPPDHGEMRYYQVLAGSYVRSLLEYDRETQRESNAVFCRDAGQIPIVFQTRQMSLLDGLKEWVQVPRGYLAHLGKRPPGADPFNYPASAQIFFSANQFGQASRPHLQALLQQYRINI